jgi:hypothetical protein
VRVLLGATIAGVLAIATACGGKRPEPLIPEPTPAPRAPASASGSAHAGSVGVTTDSEPTESLDQVLASKESKTVARTLGRVSQLRGISSTRPVPGVKLNRIQLVSRVKDKARREFPEDVLRREGQLLQLFGYAPKSFDYFAEMMKLLEAQLEGFYEPKNGTMYLAADLKGKEAQATLAHELVHALQDQNWDLKTRSTYRPGKGDESLALACLAEGDATSLMMDYVLAEQNRNALDLPEESLRELMETGVNGSSIKSVPHILRTTLIAPYIDGLTFVHALRKNGGWPKVDRAWAMPPTTTEQILHPEKWEQHEPAITIPAPTSASLGSGWKMDDEDTFGELGFALAYEEWADGPIARQAAAGWGGDRSAIYTKGDEIAFAVHERYDSASAPKQPDAFAERTLTKLAPELKKRLGKPTIEASTTLCFERPDLGPLILARNGRDFVLASGPARNDKASWTSTSTCAQAKKWADEIGAQH